MASDRLYELAFAYKKTKLWERISDSQLFAVELLNGEIGYICIMGMGCRAIVPYQKQIGFLCLR